VEKGSFEQQTYGLSYLLSQNIYTRSFYPHERLSQTGLVITLRDKLYQTWAKMSWFSKGQNLKDIRNYFGEKLALHFAFCIFYRNWLIVYAVTGVIVFSYGMIDYFR
jgi:hypothetical protein